MAVYEYTLSHFTVSIKRNVQYKKIAFTEIYLDILKIFLERKLNYSTWKHHHIKIEGNLHKFVK